MVATEPVEVQVSLEDEDPRVNTRGSLMLGVAAGRDRQYSVVERELVSKSRVCHRHVLYKPPQWLMLIVKGEIILREGLLLCINI